MKSFDICDKQSSDFKCSKCENMASAGCIRTFPSHVQIYDDKSVDDLVIEWNGQNKTETESHSLHTSNPRCSRLKRPQSTPNPGRRPVNTAGSAPATKHCDWLDYQAVVNLQEKADPESKKTKTMYESVLQTEDTFVKDMEGLVRHKDMLNQRKKELLHKTWADQVHQPIRRQVVGQMIGPGYKELQYRKRELHKEYLEHVNKKGHVFLDTTAPDEYYAMSLHPTRPSLLVAETKNLRDPLLAQERERYNEDRVIFRCEAGSYPSNAALAQMRLPPLPLVPLGRHGTECSTWLEMPMGDMESPVRFASRQRMNPCRNSHIDYHMYGRVPSPSMVQQELQIQRRRPANKCGADAGPQASKAPKPANPIAAL